MQECFYKLRGKPLLKRTLACRSSEERLDEDGIDCVMRLSQIHQLAIRSTGIVVLMED